MQLITDENWYEVSTILLTLLAVQILKMMQHTDFAGAASTPAPTTRDMHYKQQSNHYNEQLLPRNSTSSSLASEVTTATLPLIEENYSLLDPLPMAPVHVETSFPFLDALAPRLDEFTTADEGFRTYLETQLGQYDFPMA